MVLENIIDMDTIKQQLQKLIEEFNSHETKSDPYMEKRLAEVFTGMHGKYTRMKIILTLAKTPMNTLQLSKKLGHEYKAIQRNLRILEENNFVESSGGGYGNVFFLSELLLSNISILLEVIEKVDKRLASKKIYID